MQSTIRTAALAGLAPTLLAFAAPALAANAVTITSQTAGPTVFIEKLAITMTGSSTLSSVKFAITPRSGSFTRPLSATYSAGYMISRGYWDGTSASLTIPVFGLYSGATNKVTLSFAFTDGTSTSSTASIATGAYSDSCNALTMPISKAQGRTSTAELSFDFMLLKKFCSKDSPTIMDTDGEVRWVATDNVAAQASLLFNGMFYKSDAKSGVNIVQWDGAYSKLADYKSMGVTYTDHHNFDPGRDGIVMDVDTTTETEAVDVEIDATGKVLNTWDLGAMISAAMTAGGDDPSQFVAPVGTDWFHNNSTLYNSGDNTLIVSSRENFVIAVGYDDHKIKWIIGDPTKHWHQFQSLRKFELRPVANTGTPPPIGQHAVSFDDQGNLRLFDNGYKSVYQKPQGQQRNYSTPRSYKLDLTARTYEQVFSYPQARRLYANICGSAYEDFGTPGNFLVDYPSLDARKTTVLAGVNAQDTKVFNFAFPNVLSCGTAWNAQIVHLENLQF